MDIEQQVLNAFQVEHKEQLQRIRTLLLDLERLEAQARESCLDEAFRMAHSLKGGARVCDLRPVESLGHGLETVFSQLREGSLQLTGDVEHAIGVILDGIEDWMATRLQSLSPAEPAEALQALQQLLDTPANPAASEAESDSVDQQLLEEFRTEYHSYVDGLREFVGATSQGGAEKPQRWEEAFRLAHDLRASARAAGVECLQAATQSLESLFRQLRDQIVQADDQFCQSVLQYLDQVDAHLERLFASDVIPNRRPVAPSKADHAANPRGTDRRSVSQTTTAEARRTIDTVRINADSLDRLLESNGQLLIEGQRQLQFTRELTDLRRNLDNMQRQREAFRRSATASLRRMADDPEMRHLSQYVESMEKSLQVMSQRCRQLQLQQQKSCWQLQVCGNQIQRDIRQTRMVSAESMFQAFPKMVRDLARGEGKTVEFRLQGAEVRADRMVLQALKDPLMHMLRNAVIHGIERPDERLAQGKPETGSIRLMVNAVGNQLQISVADDGRGIDRQRVAEVAGGRGAAVDGKDVALPDVEVARLIFQAGFSTCNEVTELAGRGMGLSVVDEAVKRLQGHVELRPHEPAGTRIELHVPLSVCTHRLLLVTSNAQVFAIPLRSIERLLSTRREDIQTLEGRPVILYNEQPVPVVGLAALLGISDDCLTTTRHALSTMILKNGSRRVALGVDSFVGERDALVQDVEPGWVGDLYAGAILTETGSPVLVLNPAQVLGRDHPATKRTNTESIAEPAEQRLPRVLVVDDSFTTRTLEKNILETHGYQVHVAVDGVEALSKLQSDEFDAVISDLEMPRLDGFGLLEQMKGQPRLAGIPYILVTSRDCVEDRQRGLDMGAEAYIVKRRFDHQELLHTIQQVI